MADYSRPETVSLSDLKTRIHATDLVPSRTSLLENIDAIFEKISQQGIHTWMDLQKALKTPKHLEVFSKETGIDSQYLVLLRREVEGYHPKPFEIKDIVWIPQDVVTKLVGHAITNSEILLSMFNVKSQGLAFAENNGIDPEIMRYLVNLASLCKVQWVSPTTARMLIEAGCENCKALSSANADELFKAMDRVNENGKYFKGTIGLRDIKRLIVAAKYFV